MEFIEKNVKTNIGTYTNTIENTGTVTNSDDNNSNDDTISNNIDNNIKTDDNNNNNDNSNNINLINNNDNSIRMFQGHKKSITCLNINYNNNILASGSDDNSVRIWDIVTGKCNKCIIGNISIDSISFSMKDDNLIYIACNGNFLKLYDCKRNNQVIINEEILSLEFSSDINAICCHHKGQYLAVSDDTGTIMIIDIQQDHKIIKRLSRIHSNIVSSINFRNNFNSHLGSGGFDCLACTWDFNTGRPISSTNFSRENIQSNNITMINPPFIQSLHYAFNGKVLVCGLGDGTIRLLSPKDSMTVDIVEAHGGTITCMSILESNEKNFIFSGGIDMKVKCWEIVNGNNTNKKKNSFKYNIIPLWTIDHDLKINAIIPIFSAKNIKIYVADTDNKIYEYTR